MDAARFGRRTVIIGNSGSGKTTLAKILAGHFGIPALDLDRVHWQGAVGTKRDEEEARQMTRDEAAKQYWVIEGVYGWLAEAALPRATALIWLDLPWETCRAGLLARGPWTGVDGARFAEFLAWAEAYATRQTSTSLAGHARIFNAFAGEKMRLDGRSAVDAFIEELAGEKR
jgi:adenylate kinase family enzyme